MNLQLSKTQLLHQEIKDFLWQRFHIIPDADQFYPTAFSIGWHPQYFLYYILTVIVDSGAITILFNGNDRDDTSYTVYNFNDAYRYITNLLNSISPYRMY